MLLGEASHGTSQFYQARAAITRRLIEKHGFSIVAVEADWPDAAVVNRHVRVMPGAEDNAPTFERFPTWMWRNTDVASFVRWLRSAYGRMAISSGFARCEKPVVEMLTSLLEREVTYAAADGESFLDAAQNARHETGAVSPLPTRLAPGEEETWPWGL